MAEQRGRRRSARTPVTVPQAETSLLVNDRGDAHAGEADLSGELGGGTRGPGHRPSRACVRRTGSARPRSQRRVAPGGHMRSVLNRIRAGFSGPARVREPVGRWDGDRGAERRRCRGDGARSGAPRGPHGSDEARERVCRPPSRENATCLVYLCMPMGRRWARRPALPIGVAVRAAAERRCLTGQGARPCAYTPRLRHVGAARSSQT